MAVKVFKSSEYQEPAKELLRQGKTIKEVMSELPVPERSVYRWQKEVQAEKDGKPPEDKGSPLAKVVTKATDFAVVTTKAPGPIIFRMGDQTIDLNPVDLYDAWKYCQDIKTMEPAIDDNFALMLKVGAKHMWEHFSEREAHRVGVSLELKEGQ